MIGWRKSSFSDVNTNCVEVALTPDCVRVRDSKNPAARLTLAAAGWRVFVASLDR